MSRKHRYWLENCESPTSSATIQEPASVSDDEDTVGDGCNYSDLYLRNICMFYMKLQGQYLLPVSTIQDIIEEMQNIHELGQAYTMIRLNLLLKDMSIPDEDIVKITDTIKQSDLFTACHIGPMRTVYLRTQCFKDMFKYVEQRWEQDWEVCLLCSCAKNFKRYAGVRFLAGAHVSGSFIMFPKLMFSLTVVMVSFLSQTHFFRKTQIVSSWFCTRMHSKLWTHWDLLKRSTRFWLCTSLYSTWPLVYDQMLTTCCWFYCVQRGI